ncbi:YbdD/YjiX family protein [Neisseria sp. CCUG12390]|uniref:YbdD/YjiX family protein n=1 Tax=Neisseria sp. CCUG12390 TaxID=3392035 RepID=UPI003A0FC730
MSNNTLWQRICRALKAARRTADLMAGMPDYENYVARQRRHNPDAPVMTKLQFQDYCSKRRCGSNGGRCC